MEQKPIITLRNVTKVYHVGSVDVHALRGVDLTVAPGELCCIIGRSGSGKSTLLNLLAGLEPATSGEIIIANKHLERMNQSELILFRQKHVGFIFQSFNLMPYYTALENVAFPLSFRGVPKAVRLRRAKEALKTVGLESHMKHKPSQMSGGQQQRVGIARALAVKPEFIVCDEPISALDVSIQSQVVNMLEDMQQDLGLTYLFIAHDLSVVRHISNRIGVMYLGCLVELAESYELNRHPLHPYTKTLLSAVPVPDPEVSRSRQRIVLEGDIPSPMNPPTGCRFHTRCPYATDKCKQAVPEFKEHAPGHWAACHLLG